MKTLDEMIREYRIELYKACDGRIGLQAWKYKGKPGAEEEIRANKDALVAELVRRERKRKTNEERKHREHILNLQKEYPVNLPDLNVGDLVAWYDQRMPFSYGIRRADSICTGEAFDWDPEYVIILSLDHGESLAEELSVECWQLDAFQAGEPLGLGHDDYELQMHKVIRDWIEAHKERRISASHPTTTYYHIERDEAIALAGKVRETVAVKAQSILDNNIKRHIDVISRYNHQNEKPLTEAEARKLWKRDNDMYNEGGSGYVYDYVSRERAEECVAWLQEHDVTDIPAIKD